MPSTVIRYFRYDPSARELQVTFVSGRRYVYEEVPQDVFDAFRTTSSKGVFFNRRIRDHFSYREVTREQSV